MDQNRENYVTVMKCYIDTMKSVVQLSIAALVLPVVFLREVLAVEKTQSLLQNMNTAFIISWVFLLIATGLGIYYQVAAARRIRDKVWETSSPRLFPVFAFRGCIGAFAIGIVAFLVAVSLS